jgi:mRNA interferase RelE/StbE
MKLVFTERFVHSLDIAPVPVRKAMFKQLTFLERSLRHPSLRAKKYDEAHDLWQARVTRDWRFYFTIEGDQYRLVDLRPHRK